MPLDTKTFDQFVLDQAEGFGAALGFEPSLIPGDPALAIFETNATQHQAQQVNIERVLNFARGATATGEDLDSFVNEFGFYRLQAQKATGTVMFSLNYARPTEMLIPVGAIVTTKTDDIQFQVIADTTKAAWNPTQNAYVIPPGQLQIFAQVEAIIPGIESNVLSNQLTKIVSTGEGPDKVTNPQPLTNGIDQEDDDSTRFRFVLYINSRSKATPEAIQDAVLGLRVGLTATLVENKDRHGNQKLGYVLVIMDDGSGEPPDALLDEAQDAVDLVRPASVQVEVIKPIIEMITAACNIRSNPDLESLEVRTAVDQALTDYINQRKVGETLYLSDLMRVILAVEGVVAVQPNSLVINGQEADYIPGSIEVVKTNNVTVGSY